MPMNELAATGAGVIYPENSSNSGRHKTMTNSNKSDVMGVGGAGGPGLRLGLELGMSSLQGQKWQQIFDMDKVIKQLRTAEKTYLRGGGQKSGQGNGNGARASSGVQVQRLNIADIAYYDIVPKMATRDLVVCNSCNGSYTKPGFQNHVALQHPNIWEATSNKLIVTHNLSDSHRHGSDTTAGQDGAEPNASGSPLESSNLSNASSSSASIVAATSSSSSASSSTTTTASSSRHKSSSKSSSSSKGSSSGNSSRSRSKSSKNRHHSTPAAPALELNHKEKSASKKNNGTGGGSSSSSSSIISAIAAPPTAAAIAATIPSIKEDPISAHIAHFSSSSNSSCSLPPTPTLLTVGNSSGQLADSGLSVNYSPANHQMEDKSDLQPKKKLKGSSDHRTKSSKEKVSVVVSVPNPYDQQQQQQQQQQLSELDQAVSSITGHVAGMGEATDDATPTQGEDDEELPLPNTSDDNSISLTLDEMLDSKLINEILNNFDESALDTSQQQNGASAQATKRLRYEEAGTEMANETVAVGDSYAIYQNHQHQQQQQQQQQQQVQQQQVFNDDNQSQLTAIDAMQLQQLIYQQQQMLEQVDHQPKQEEQQQQQQQNLHEDQQGTIQFSVYNVPSLTDPDTQPPTQQQQQQQLDEHMILPSIIYEITDNNQVSVLDQQSQQQVIAEFLTQAGYENVLQEAQVGGADYADELNDIDFSKLETTKTVKLEATTTTTNTSTTTINAKSLEDTYLNAMLYATAPRPLAMNTFGLVKLPNGLGTTLRKNLLTTRKANNSLLSLNGSSGVVGQLTRPPPPLPPIGTISSIQPNLINGHGIHGRNSNSGKTIYAQKSSVIAQERVRCNKRPLINVKFASASNPGQMTAKKLNDLLMGKVKKEEKLTEDEAAAEKEQKEEMDKQTLSFYEKRRKLMAKPHLNRHHSQHHQMHQQHHHHHHPSINHNSFHSLHSPSSHLYYHRQRSLNLPLALQSHPSSQQLLKKQLLRTLSDSSNILAASQNNNNNNNNNSSSNNNNTPPTTWKSQSSTPGNSSTPTNSDLMRVFV